MKKIVTWLLIIMAVLTTTGCATGTDSRDNDDSTDTEQENVQQEEEYDPSKEVIIRGYWLSDSDEYEEEYVYDSDGNLLSIIAREAETGEFKNRYDYEYDSQNQLVKEEYRYFEDGDPFNCYTYEYDDMGRLAKRFDWEILNEDVYEWWEYVYGEEGILTRINQYSELDEKKLIGEETFSYDEEGRLVSSEEVLLNADLHYPKTYEYDEHGNMIRQTEQYGDNSIINVYEYDEYNRVTKWSQTTVATHLITDDVYEYSDITTYEYGIID